MKKTKTQKQMTLEMLLNAKGQWVDFRTFRYKGISQPGSRSSELRDEGYPIVNRWYYNKDGQKCSYYALNPKKTFEEAKRCKELIIVSF